MLANFLGGWCIAIGYSAILRWGFGVDAKSVWNWGVCIAIILIATFAENVYE